MVKLARLTPIFDKQMKQFYILIQRKCFVHQFPCLSDMWSICWRWGTCELLERRRESMAAELNGKGDRSCRHPWLCNALSGAKFDACVPARNKRIAMWFSKKEITTMARRCTKRSNVYEFLYDIWCSILMSRRETSWRRQWKSAAGR